MQPFHFGGVLARLLLRPLDAVHHGSVLPLDYANSVAAVEVVHASGNLDNHVAGFLGRFRNAAVKFATGVAKQDRKTGLFHLSLHHRAGLPLLMTLYRLIGPIGQ
jgi:hypothetical protein